MMVFIFRLNMPTCAKFLRTIQAPKIQVDDEGKAKTFRMFSLARPYMRSLHASWTCFFIAFLSWFGIQPLLPTISRELGLTKLDLARSGIASVSATICVRMFVGPFCDRFGPRRVMAGLLMVGAIPMSLSGLVKNGTGLIIIRLFIGRFSIKNLYEKFCSVWLNASTTEIKAVINLRRKAVTTNSTF